MKELSEVKVRSKIIKAATLLSITILLAGCGDYSEYRKADGEILCHPLSLEAFFVNTKAGAVSQVQRSPRFDYICKKQGEQK